MDKWKSIVGYKGVYEVNNLGQVRSNPRIVLRSDGVRRKFPGKLLEPSLVSGYPAVSLSKGNKSVKCYIHDLVLKTFVGICPKGYCARHYPDSDKTNNKLSNLQWGTHAENTGDHLGRYITDADVEEMHTLRDEGIPQKKIAKQFDCTQGYVSTILSNHRRPVAEPTENRSTRGDWWTDQMLLEILNSKNGESRRLAERFGVCQAYISDIRRGRKLKSRTSVLREVA